jgi:eukaryotic-like serine/threonine-protein kinase
MASVSPAADRNLLFGILALQMEFVTRDALIAAMHAWVLAKQRPLGDLLQERGALSPSQRQALDLIASEHLKAHGGDPQRSLAAMALPSTLIEDLESVADAEVEASMASTGLSSLATVSARQPIPNGARYEVLRPHARGGLGLVSVARDAELGRDVALKEIQDEFADDAENRNRFLREAEVTGGLEHPGIVPVYGLGAFTSGRPYYAMRLIRGESLQEAVRKLHAGDTEYTLRGLLTRFVVVCNTVAYAHSRGVIHRDLKPANVMLGPYGETLVVDWGLAKVVGSSSETRPVARAPEGTLLVSGGDESVTRAGSLLGTPGYMSPEQARGEVDTLKRATDIYSLGATLYTMLTGQPPVRGDDAIPILEKVWSGDWPPPRQVNATVPHALDAICRKAMAMRPGDRYDSALSLAADVEHWLADEPVTAYREPLPARLGRWGRRNQQAVIGGVILLAAAMISSVAITVTSERARKQAELAERATVVQKEIAESNAAQTRAVLDFVSQKVFAAARPKGQEGGLGREVTLRQAVEAALPFVAKRFQHQPLIEARLRMELGNSFTYLGDPQLAADQYLAAGAILSEHEGPDHADTLTAMNNLAASYANLGRQAEALKLYEDTFALRKAKLGPDHPDTLQSMNNLANSFAAVDRQADALQLREQTVELMKQKLGADHRDTLKSMNNLANSYLAVGRPADALNLLEKTLELQKDRFGPDDADALQSMDNLANICLALGRVPDSVKLHEQTLELRKAKFGPDHRETLQTMNNLAVSYAAAGRQAEALKLRQETVVLMKSKLGTDDSDTLMSMYNLANSYGELGRVADALQLHQETLALRKANLGASHLNTLWSMFGVATCLAKLDRGAEALATIDECLRLVAGKVVDAELIPSVLDLRLRHFQKTKDAGGCRETAVMLEKLNRADAVTLYNAACFRAVTAALCGSSGKSAVAGNQGTPDADQAMAWLQKAIAAGVSDAAQVEKDDDLAYLRGRDDFQRAVAALRAGDKSKK